MGSSPNYKPVTSTGVLYAETIRTAALNWEASNASSQPSCRIGWNTCGLKNMAVDYTVDGLHMSETTTTATTGARLSNRRMIQSVIWFLNAGVVGPSGNKFSGRGPSLIVPPTVTVSAQTIVFSILHEGGNQLILPVPASPPSGFLGNTAADFSGTYIPLTVSLINSNTQIQIVLPAGTLTGSNTIYIKFCGGQIGSTTILSSPIINSSAVYVDGSTNPDTSNLPYDNVSYPSWASGTDIQPYGLPLLPTAGAVAIS